MTSPSREQKSFYNRFVQLLEDDNFLSDIEYLRSSDQDITKTTYENFEEFDDGTVNADEVPLLLNRTMTKYNLSHDFRLSH